MLLPTRALAFEHAGAKLPPGPKGGSEGKAARPQGEEGRPGGGRLGVRDWGGPPAPPDRGPPHTRPRLVGLPGGPRKDGAAYGAHCDGQEQEPAPAPQGGRGIRGPGGGRGLPGPPLRRRHSEPAHGVVNEL
jgi:hypothetical protein